MPWAIFFGSVAYCLYFDLRSPEQRLIDQTAGLPPVTTAELFVLDDSQKMPAGQGFPLRPYGHEVAILDQKTITGEEAEQLAQIWRTREFGGGGAMCHYPVYGLRFRSGWRLLMETSICWECINCYVEDQAGTFKWYGIGDLDRLNNKGEIDFTLLRKLRGLLPPPPKIGAAIAAHIGSSALFSKQYAEAKTELDAAAQLDPQSYRIRNWRAIYFEKTGQPLLAIDEITVGLPYASKWQREHAFAMRAKLRLKSGQLDAALQDTTDALKEHDEGWSSSEHYQLRAEIYEKLGRKEDAEKDRQAAKPK